MKEIATGLRYALSREPLALGILLFIVVLFGANEYFANKRYNKRAELYKPLIDICVKQNKQ